MRTWLTARSYYINPPGYSPEEACVWGSKDKPIGNVSAPPPPRARLPADRRASGARTSPARTPCTVRRSSSLAGTPSTSSRT